MTNNKHLIDRLLAACNGHPHALIPWPHRLLHEAAEALQASESAAAPRMTVIAWTSGGRFLDTPEEAQAMRQRGFKVKPLYSPADDAAPQPPASAKPPWTTCPDCGYDIARASAKPLSLTDERANEICQNRTFRGGTLLDLLRDVEAAHGIKEQP